MSSRTAAGLPARRVGNAVQQTATPTAMAAAQRARFRDDLAFFTVQSCRYLLEQGSGDFRGAPVGSRRKNLNSPIRSSKKGRVRIVHVCDRAPACAGRQATS